MKFGKHIREQVQTLGPEWQRSVLPYKSLKKAIKHDELDLETLNKWHPILSTAWSEKLDMLSNLYIIIENSSSPFERDFYQLLCRSVVTLRRFLDEAFFDTKHRITDLQNKLYSCTNPFGKDLKTWKAILACYKDFDIWSISTVAQLKKISFLDLTKQYKLFLNQIQSQKLANQQLISLLRFCELNQLAATKIMKKFSKATHKQLCLEVAKKSISPLYYYPSNTLQLWWDVIDKTLPNLEDYLCPICLEISWKPTRLQCGHIFCHWCCIQSQIRRTQHCPICRSPGTMSIATEKCTDVALANYLKTYFPDEVRQRKKNQEKEIMLSEVGHLQGAEFVANMSCSIM